MARTVTSGEASAMAMAKLSSGSRPRVPIAGSVSISRSMVFPSNIRGRPGVHSAPATSVP